MTNGHFMPPNLEISSMISLDFSKLIGNNRSFNLWVIACQPCQLLMINVVNDCLSAMPTIND